MISTASINYSPLWMRMLLDCMGILKFQKKKKKLIYILQELNKLSYGSYSVPDSTASQYNSCQGKT